MQSSRSRVRLWNLHFLFGAANYCKVVEIAGGYSGVRRLDVPTRQQQQRHRSSCMDAEHLHFTFTVIACSSTSSACSQCTLQSNSRTRSSLVLRGLDAASEKQAYLCHHGQCNTLSILNIYLDAVVKLDKVPSEEISSFYIQFIFHFQGTAISFQGSLLQIYFYFVLTYWCKLAVNYFFNFHLVLFMFTNPFTLAKTPTSQAT